ncbi:tyrosine-type recombinase/integrase [Bacillus taeanensis]|nr:tyrosine-type recombinase/integrase [Bacillus taeanensis]
MGNKGEISDSIDSYSTWLLEEGKSKNTVKTYVGVLHAFESWLIEKKRNIYELSTDDIQGYINYLQALNRSTSTVEKIFTAIRMYAHFQNKLDLVQNIQRKAKKKTIETPPVSLNHNEQNKLLQRVKQDHNLRNITIVYTLLHTGIRISELCFLNRSDIFMMDGKGTLTVRNEDGKIDRKIPLSQETQYYLEHYLNELETESEALFLSNVSNRISPRAVQYMLKKYNVNPHKLRHTFCQELINKGVSLAVVAKLAGHSDINVTRRYIHLLSDEIEDAIERTFA